MVVKAKAVGEGALGCDAKALTKGTHKGLYNRKGQGKDEGQTVDIGEERRSRAVVQPAKTNQLHGVVG